MIFKIKNEELVRELVGEEKDFPKYTTQILNLANQNAQGTRPRVVGQLSELIGESHAKTYTEWKKWYFKKHPHAIHNAAQKIEEMVEKLKEAIFKINKELITQWVEDLIIEKTFVGLRFQEAILKRLVDRKNLSYRLATPAEESRGIDGFVGDTPVSIKPDTYRTKPALLENLLGKVVFYKKTKTGIEVDAKSVL